MEQVNNGFFSLLLNHIVITFLTIVKEIVVALLHSLRHWKGKVGRAITLERKPSKMKQRTDTKKINNHFRKLWF